MFYYTVEFMFIYKMFTKRHANKESIPVTELFLHGTQICQKIILELSTNQISIVQNWTILVIAATRPLFFGGRKIR